MKNVLTNVKYINRVININNILNIILIFLYIKTQILFMYN